MLLVVDAGNTNVVFAVHDENAESEPDQPAGGLPGSLADAQVRTRSQADLVRESLVRCPGAGSEPVAR